MSQLKPRPKLSDAWKHPHAFWTTLIPRTKYAVVERDGLPELVIWRMWLADSYDIVSLAGGWGRWDRNHRAAVSTSTESEK